MIEFLPPHEPVSILQQCISEHEDPGDDMILGG